MANQWVRLWVDMPDDPKFRLIARRSKQPLLLVQGVYIRMMIAAANADERGRTQTNAAIIAASTESEEQDVQEVIDAMQGVVLDGDFLTGWSKRQPVREDGSAERSKAWRQKNATERNRTQPNAKKRSDTDTDTDTDTDKTSSVFSSSSQESISSVETKLCARRGKPLDYTDEFNEFWTQYPKRHGANAKPSAWRAWSQRVRDGCGPGSMIHGAQRYAAYCDAKGITGTEYVMQAVRFIGPDRHFENDWRKPNATGYVFDANDRPF